MTQEQLSSEPALTIDVKQVVRQALSSVPLQHFVDRGMTTLKVISGQKLNELINRAVRNVLETYQRSLTPTEEGRVAEEAREEFLELVGRYQESQRTTAELDRTRQDLSQELQALRLDLERQKSLADKVLSEETELAVILGFKEFEAQLDRTIDKVIKRRGMILRENGEIPPQEAERLLGQARSELEPILRKLVADERSRFLKDHPGAVEREIALLERRIEKLAQYIESLEAALRTLQKSGGITSREVSNLLRKLGLLDDDPNYEKKSDMLKRIYQENVNIQKERETVAVPSPL